MRLFLFIALVAFVLQLILPWWVLAIVAFGLAFWLGTGAGQAFLAGFAGIGIGWLGLALFQHIRNEGLLTAKVATLFTLPHPLLLLGVTVLTGSLVGGFSALAGYFVRKAL